MSKLKKTKIGVVVLAIVLIGSAMVLPMSGAVIFKTNKTPYIGKILSQNIQKINEFLSLEDPDNDNEQTEIKSIPLDRIYINQEDLSLDGNQNDIGYNIDTGNQIVRSMPVYIGEPIDQTVPGRGRIGTLDAGDTDDWYTFSVCQGQTINANLDNNGNNFDFELADATGAPAGQTHTAIETGRHFIHIFSNDDDIGQYEFDINLIGQNDAGTSNDAGDDIDQGTAIIPGEYSGYMDINDLEDWYEIDVNTGQGIFVTLEPIEKSDYDVHLYNPLGELVSSAQYYGDDELEYPADISGTWSIKIDMFPGWDTSKWPENYFLYGSGAYEFEINLGGTAQLPIEPKPQPDIIPIAQTFIVTNDPDHNNDEYSYLAAVPAANYIDDGQRYVSPIIYTGDNTQTSWFGNVDDTTGYLLEDWENYLNNHDKSTTEYTLSNNPIQAAADIATMKWSSSDTVVLAVDGSQYEDNIETVIDKSATLQVTTKTTSAGPSDFGLEFVSGYHSLQMFIGREWGVVTFYADGADCPDLGILTPRYELGTAEDWPHPYDGPGDNTNIYFPVSIPGLYWPYVGDLTGSWNVEFTQYSGDRYKIPISNDDQSLKVSVTTNDPSYLEVFLVDPHGVVRRPSVPSWNGGPINPIHSWNGDHHNGFEDWRRWEPTYSTEHTVEINYPMKGRWTAIVAPHYPYGEEKTSDSIQYNIKADVRTHNEKRISSGLSAANAAVIASLKHIPLLYVNEDSIPSETQNAINSLGASNFILVNLNDISSARPSGSITEYNTMQKIVDAIKSDSNSEQVITVTSFGTGDGYFAPSGMIAAYHGSPVLTIGEVKEAYNTLDKATSFREYSGGWYHGMRAQGHLATMNKPIDLFDIIKGIPKGEFPALGIDQHLRWWGSICDEITAWIDSYGLDEEGQEAYIFVSPRNTDIRHPICTVMQGIESYAGQIPLDTIGLDAALISRDILYPAIIYANPGKDVTTTQLMNFPDGWLWTTNDGQRHSVYSSRELKKSFSSHGRFFEGHVIWENWLDRMNEGAVINYYSGHGTGGSGISQQYSNVAESFPDADIRYESLYDFDWWDGWRGYMYDDTQTKTPRWGGFTWYNAAEPNLYDIIHFKWVDQQLENLHSEIEVWMSCTTGQHFGPEIYLEHGSALWYGNAATGLCPQADLLDDSWLRDFMINGENAGEAQSKYVWLHQRDFTAKNKQPEKYEASLYGSSSMKVTNIQIFFGDPTIQCYNPTWTEPTPINP